MGKFKDNLKTVMKYYAHSMVLEESLKRAVKFFECIENTALKLKPYAKEKWPEEKKREIQEIVDKVEQTKFVSMIKARPEFWRMGRSMSNGKCDFLDDIIRDFGHGRSQLKSIIESEISKLIEKTHSMLTQTCKEIEPLSSSLPKDKKDIVLNDIFNSRNMSEIDELAGKVDSVFKTIYDSTNIFYLQCFFDEASGRVISSEYNGIFRRLSYNNSAKEQELSEKAFHGEFKNLYDIVCF